MEAVKDQILLVDDSATDREQITRMLDGGRVLDMNIREVETGEEALVALDDGPVGCILLDYSLPDMTCLDFLNMAIIPGDVAIVIFTGVNDEQLPVEALKRGAHDFLRKDNLGEDVLIHAVSHAMDRARVTGREADYRGRLELFHSLLEQSDDLLMVINLKQEVIVDMNEPARRLLRVDRHEVMGYTESVDDAFSASKEEWRALRAQTAVSDSGRLETEMILAGHRRLPVEVRARRVNVGVNEFHTAVVRDVADRRLLRRELVRTENHDPQSGLFDSGGLRILLSEFWEQARADGETLGVVMVGLVEMASFASSAGEEAAHECRMRICKALQDQQHGFNECLARLDADRFVMLVRCLHDEDMNLLVDKIHSAVGGLVQVHPVTGNFVGVKVASVNRAARELEDPASLLEQAAAELFRRGWRAGDVQDATAQASS